MNSPILTWKNRSIAALDLFHISQTNPASILSERALLTLISIRSPSVANDLLSVILGEERTKWEVIYALRAFAVIPEDQYAPQIAVVSQKAWQSLQELVVEHSNNIHQKQKYRDFMNVLVACFGIAVQHPSNRLWFFEQMQQVRPDLAVYSIEEALRNEVTEGNESVLLQHLEVLLEYDPHLIDFDIACHILQYGNDQGKAWLSQYFDLILQKAVAYGKEHRPNDSMHLGALLQLWPEMRNRFVKLMPAVGADYINPGRHPKGYRFEKLDYEATSIWQHLNQLHDRVITGDQNALNTLFQTVFDEQTGIPERASATFFLGKLQQFTGVIETLCELLQYANDDWKSDAPIRFEAGQALRDSASIAAWEAMMNTSLMRPHDALFLVDWIRYLTDILSGVNEAYKGAQRDAIRPWFNALVSQ